MPASELSRKSSRPVGAQVNAYLTAQPAATRKILRQIRSAVRSAAPAAVEVFSYGIPGFRIDGQPLVWYAGWKGHVSLYPMRAAIARAFADELEGCGFSTGTIRFPLSNPPSTSLVKRLVKARMAEARRKPRK